jgi:hypothetical protein
MGMLDATVQQQGHPRSIAFAHFAAQADHQGPKA